MHSANQPGTVTHSLAVPPRALDRKLYGVSLCSGIGGLELGVIQACAGLGISYQCLCYVEREIFAASVLASHMASGDLDQALIWDDITTFDGKPYCGLVDIVSAGLPCQPFSVAGKRKGFDDERAFNVWPHFFRIIEEVCPSMVFIENVPGLLQFFRPIGEQLCGMGYEFEAGLFSAEEVGAPHKRERLFILAHSQSMHARVKDDSSNSFADQWHSREKLIGRGGYLANTGCIFGASRTSDSGRPERDRDQDGCAALADASGARLEIGRCEPGNDGPEFPTVERASLPEFPPGPADTEAWRRIFACRPDLAPAVKSEVCPMAYGISSRVDMLRALGNAVVPATAEYAFQTLLSTLPTGNNHREPGQGSESGGRGNETGKKPHQTIAKPMD
jgi:DNA (cytosine-5)-methyltransferase 1